VAKADATPLRTPRGEDEQNRILTGLQKAMLKLVE